jgi:hypothetical protein
MKLQPYPGLAKSMTTPYFVDEIPDRAFGAVNYFKDSSGLIVAGEAIDDWGVSYYMRGNMLVCSKVGRAWLRQRYLWGEQRKRRLGALYAIAFARYMEYTCDSAFCYSSAGKRKQDRAMRFKSRLVRMCHGSPDTARHY